MAGKVGAEAGISFGRRVVCSCYDPDCRSRDGEKCRIGGRDQICVDPEKQLLIEIIKKRPNQKIIKILQQVLLS